MLESLHCDPIVAFTTINREKFDSLFKFDGPVKFKQIKLTASQELSNLG